MSEIVRDWNPGFLRAQFVWTHVVLNSALKQAVRWGMLSINHAQNAELPRCERKEMMVLSSEESVRFLEAEGRAAPRNKSLPMSLKTCFSATQ